MSCGSLPTSCQAQLIKQAGLPFGNGQLGTVQFISNTASGYGDDLATDASDLFLYGAPTAQKYEYVPGDDALNFTVAIYDSLGAMVIGSEDVVRVCLCPASTSQCNQVSSLVPAGFYPFSRQSGLCSVASKQAVVCSLASQSLLVAMSLVASTLVETLFVEIQCLPCKEGQARTEDKRQGIWNCVSCEAGQYVVDSNNSAYRCVQCPQGAFCDGGIMRSRVAGATWVPDPSIGQFRLTSCPVVSVDRKATCLRICRCQ